MNGRDARTTILYASGLGVSNYYYMYHAGGSGAFTIIYFYYVYHAGGSGAFTIIHFYYGGGGCCGDNVQQC